MTDNGSPLHRLFLVMRGIRRTDVKKNPLTCLPITGHILARVCSLLTKGVFGPYMDLLLQAACNLAFFAFLRCGEFTLPSSKFDHTKGLSFSDVTIAYEGQIATKLILKLKSSKTNPFRKGRTIVLFPTGAQLCPVRYMLNFMKVRAPFVLDPSEPLFMTNHRVYIPLMRGMFVGSIRHFLCHLGLNPSHYAGHSLRIGAAMSAAESNIPDHLIKTMGRWSSDCYERYIRTSPSLLRSSSHCRLARSHLQ